MFEDTIVDFFESADVKGDRVLDEDEFREVGHCDHSQDFSIRKVESYA